MCHKVQTSYSTSSRRVAKDTRRAAASVWPFSFLPFYSYYCYTHHRLRQPATRSNLQQTAFLSSLVGRACFPVKEHHHYYWVPLSPGRQQPTPQGSYAQRRRMDRLPSIGRSVHDFKNQDTLRESLSDCNLAEGGTVEPGQGQADWMLPVTDADAREEDVDTEVSRLWTLRSYLALDASKEEAFDKLCEEARTVYNVPVSAISLVDLGRQFAFASAGVTPPHARNTERSIAFCSHTILNKKEVMVVKDTLKDERFRNNPLVTKPPFLRFYAGAPLVSPEGYHLGTFCVESPEPRPEGLTDEQTSKLSEFASRTVELLVKRRDKLRQRVGDTADKSDEGLLRHAGVATNLGGLLFNVGEYMTAMKLYQESVQTLMLLKEESTKARPSRERQAEMSNLLTMLGAEGDTDSSHMKYIELAKQLMKTAEDAAQERSSGALPAFPPTSGIPALYGHESNFKGMERRELAELVFSEPFRITVNEAIDTVEHFIIPLDECSKATLFNMGLIHYHWGNSDTAMQFFDLASSLSQQLSPLSFDPVVLGSFNNMAQIHLQYRRTNDAMELLKDACARGNAALNALVTTNEKGSGSAAKSDDYVARRSRRLRRKLARTVLNLGRVHFVNSEYDAAMATCHDALRLLHTNTEDAEMAAVYYNIAVIQYHQGNKTESLENLDTFLHRAKPIVGPDHLQIAEAMHDKGVTLFEMSSLDDSMISLREALRIRRLRLGQNHVSVAESLCLIGKVLVSREDYESGLAAYLEGLGVYREIAGSEPLSFNAAQVLLDVGRVYQAQGKLEESIKTYEEATTMTQKFFGAEHSFVARLHNILGNLYNEVGQTSKSEKNFEEARRIMAKHNIPYTASTVLSVNLPMPPNG